MLVRQSAADDAADSVRRLCSFLTGSVSKPFPPPPVMHPSRPIGSRETKPWILYPEEKHALVSRALASRWVLPFLCSYMLWWRASKSLV